MAMGYGPISNRLSRSRAPVSRMPAIRPDYDEDDMPPGQGDLGEEVMAGEHGIPQPAPVQGGPGPMARALLVHSPAEAAKQRGYAMPQLDRPEIPSMRDPRHASDPGELHTAQHQSITRGLNQRRWMAQQRLMQEHQRLSQIVKAGKAGQDVEQAQQRLSTIEALIKSLGVGSAPGE